MAVSVIPVIHYSSDEQCIRNAERVFEADCEGVFLIEMDGDNRWLTPVARVIKERWPHKIVGINFLGVDPEDAVAANVAAGLDMTWTDIQLTHSHAGPWERAQRIRKVMGLNPGHLLFSGVSFKHQRDEPMPGFSALKAVEFGFIPTTSGPSTGVAAEEGKISDLRLALGADAPLAIASGITPENVHSFAPYLTHVLVATGVSSSFHEFDSRKLHSLHAFASRD